MPTAQELLKKDHRTVEQLFARFQETRDRSIAMQICDELEEHTKVEEKIVYPELKKVDQDLYEDAVEEHDEVDGIIKQVRGLGDNEREKLAQLMTRMQELVEHHVEDEESEDFPAMERSCGHEVMERLGRRIEEFKQGGAGSDGKAELLDLTKEELYEEARQAGIEGRSKMDKDELADAVARHRR